MLFKKHANATEVTSLNAIICFYVIFVN